MQSDTLIVVRSVKDVNISDVALEVSAFIKNTSSLSTDFQSSEEVIEKLNIIKQAITEYAECNNKIAIVTESSNVVVCNVIEESDFDNDLVDMTTPSKKQKVNDSSLDASQSAKKQKSKKSKKETRE